MKSTRKGKKKLVITFDPDARREYLTGFQKRKKLRKHKVKLQKEHKEKLIRKEEKQEKTKLLRSKLDKYGLVSDDEDEEVKEENSTVLDHHPHHVVVVDMQPQFGPSLTSMAEEHDQQT